MTSLPGLADGKLKDLTPLRAGPLARALETLNGRGEETRLVGGAVRDLARGEGAADLDLATTATTDEIIRRARNAGFKVALTGVAHGTVTIVIDGCPLETTTLREDVETDGTVGQSRVRPRLRHRRAATRFHHQRAVAEPRRNGP